MIGTAADAATPSVPSPSRSSKPEPERGQNPRVLTGRATAVYQCSDVSGEEGTDRTFVVKMSWQLRGRQHEAVLAQEAAKSGLKMWLALWHTETWVV
jgi:hypothetical protein